MDKKVILLVLTVAIAVSSVGCSGPWRRKFVRAKRSGEVAAPTLQPKDYSKEFSNRQLYANHFAFWKNAEAETIYCLVQDNQRRLKTYAIYALAELKKLNDLLVEDKKGELLPFLEELADILEKINQPYYVDSHRNQLVESLRKHYRVVSGRFSYFNMKGYIAPDKEPAKPDEAPAKPAEPAPIQEPAKPNKEEPKPEEKNRPDEYVK